MFLQSLLINISESTWYSSVEELKNFRRLRGRPFATPPLAAYSERSMLPRACDARAEVIEVLLNLSNIDPDRDLVRLLMVEVIIVMLVMIMCQNESTIEDE